MRHGLLLGLAALGLVAGAGPLTAAERPMMPSPVPADQIAAARALTNPLPDSPSIIEQGKALYDGKGTCFNCHGTSGRGDGPAAANLDPSPRNFHHRGFWRHRTDGEVFWVIKHGSPGTAMIPFGGMLTDEEIWSVVRYERTFGERMGPGMGRGGPMGGRRRGE
jgi:mono/diheme cytochrome c family protein